MARNKIRIRSIGDVDRVVGAIVADVLSDGAAINKLRSYHSYEKRRKGLELYICDRLEKYNVSEKDFYELLIIDIFFHAMHQSGAVNLGFCEHFTPGYRGKAEYFLDGAPETDVDSYCEYVGEGVPCLCDGTNEHACKALLEERKGAATINLIKNIIDAAYDLLGDVKY